MVHFVVATHYIFLKHSVAIFANEYTEYKVVHFVIKHSTVYITREIWFTHKRNIRNIKEHVTELQYLLMSTGWCILLSTTGDCRLCVSTCVRHP